MAGADWIVADALGEEALNPGPFAMVQDNLAAWLGDPAGMRSGEREALDGLMRGLVMSGLAMQAHGNSRPASGSDHQFAHLWEMEDMAVDGVPVSHGACVGIGCLSMLAAYEWLLRQDICAIDPAPLAARAPSSDALRAEVAASFPLSFMAANAEIETLAKGVPPRRRVERRLRRPARQPGHDSRPICAGDCRSAAEVRRMARTAAGAAVDVGCHRRAGRRSTRAITRAPA